MSAQDPAGQCDDAAHALVVPTESMTKAPARLRISAAG
jgi:hypothetical protein